MRDGGGGYRNTRPRLAAQVLNCPGGGLRYSVRSTRAYCRQPAASTATNPSFVTHENT